MKKHLKAMAAALMLPVFVLAGCGSQPAINNGGANAPAQQETQAQVEPIKVGLLRIDDSFPFYVAREEDLFDKHGVAVELLDFSSARDQSTALQGGELDVIMTDPVVTALSIKGGNDMRIIANALGAVPEEGRFLIISAPESGITEPSQLEGKTLAISNNTMMDFLTEQYMKHLGVDYDAINLVNMPDLMLRTTTVLEGKDIDAAILPDPLAAYAVMGGANIVIDDTKLGENFSRSVVAVTTELVDNNREELAKLVDAYNEAIEMINANPDQYKELALKCANVPAELHDTYKTPSFTANGVVDEDYIALVCNWMVERELLDKPFAYEEIVTTEFVK